MYLVVAMYWKWSNVTVGNEGIVFLVVAMRYKGRVCVINIFFYRLYMYMCV